MKQSWSSNTCHMVHTCALTFFPHSIHRLSTSVASMLPAFTSSAFSSRNIGLFSAKLKVFVNVVYTRSQYARQATREVSYRRNGSGGKLRCLLYSLKRVVNGTRRDLSPDNSSERTLLQDHKFLTRATTQSHNMEAIWSVAQQSQQSSVKSTVSI